MSKHPPGPLHLIPDAPIASPGFDRLDRMAFVRSFAEAVRSVKGTDSVVLALAGPWGSGKSSLLNLIAGELATTAEGEPPLVVQFNPWWFSGTDQLVAAFLQQLGAAVSRPAVKEILGEATDALDHLAESLANPGANTDSDPASRDIEALRERVNSIFEKSDRRILIFMDDIDRLTPQEMTQLLLIVRAVAEFPNTTYVLSFDYEVVVNSLGSKLGVDGRTYLEKVIQLQIDVPMPGRMVLERMVIGQLQAIDPTAKNLDKESQRHFRILFESGIKHFLATPRACTRFLNVLRFTYPTLGDQVYFPDLLGISCLMSFSSQAIQAIRSFHDAFVGHCDTAGKGWLNLMQFHSSWIAEIPKRDRASVESIVRLLFPKVAWALSGPVRGEEYVEVWDRQKRICSVKHFDSYFRLGITAGEAAEHQWQHMVELLDDATAFAAALQRFGPIEEEGGEGWVAELLQQATNFVNDQATPDQARNLFRAIMSRGDQISSVNDVGSEHHMHIGPIHWVTSVLLDCLQRVDDPARRLDMLRTSVAEDAGLRTSAELLELLEYRSDIFADGKHAPTAEANTAKLLSVLKILDKRIQQASEDGELALHPQFMAVVQKWWQFGRKAKSRAWVRATCENDERFVDALLQLCLGSVSDGGHHSVDANHSLPIDWLVEFFDPGELLIRSKNIREQADWLTTEGTAALKLLAEQLSERSARQTIQDGVANGNEGTAGETTAS